MPKKKKSVKKKAKAKTDADPLPEQDKLTRASHEIALLKTELAERREEARRSTHKATTLQSEVETQRSELRERTEDTQDISTDLARQYKLMQSQLMAKIIELQERERVLQDQLDTTRQTLTETRTQADKTIREKNDMIAQLTQRIQSMETSYESVLNEALDAMASKVEAARDKWEVESYVVQQRNKEMLMEFGLSHVAI